MKRLVRDHNLGTEEQLAVGMKEMIFLARADEPAAAWQAMQNVRTNLKDAPAYLRIFRYNAAATFLSLGNADFAESEATDLIMEYYDLIGLSPKTVIGRNVPEIRLLLKETETLTDDLRHLADSLDLYAKATTRLGKIPGLSRIQAMKFYNLSQSPESLLRVGQDLADEFVQRNDFIRARNVIEIILFPLLDQMKLASFIIPVRSQYAVILAYCGDFPRAEAEMARLAPYEVGLTPKGQEELKMQQKLIADLKHHNLPPQWQMPAGAPASMTALHQMLIMPKIGRNESCPCGSGKKFKKCHG